MVAVTGGAFRGAYGECAVIRKRPRNYGFETSRSIQPAIDYPAHTTPWDILYR